MPKERQIARLFPATLASGAIVWHWKPSKTLRESGFANVKLGSDRRAAINQAEDLNEKVEAWKKGTQGDAGALAVARPLPRALRFGELVSRYRASDAFTGLKPKTRAEYGTRLKQLTVWAMDGELTIASMDRMMVLDLRNKLVEGSKFRCAAILRVLRLLMQWAVDQGMIAANPATSIDIPEPPKRRRRVIRDDLIYLIDAAIDLALPHIELAATIGFYTTQRRADLLAATRFRMKPLRDISDDARRILGGADGQVLGFVLEQGKTGTWVGIPMVPDARAAIDRAIASAGAGIGVAHTHLIARPGTPGACPDWRFQRDFRAVADRAVQLAVKVARGDVRFRNDYEHAYEAIDAARRLRGIQFRDLRRSGMCWMRDLGVPVPLIAAISGHTIEQTQKILDTYMPRDTRAAAEAMAMAVSRQSARDVGDQAARELREKQA